MRPRPNLADDRGRRLPVFPPGARFLLTASRLRDTPMRPGNPPQQRHWPAPREVRLRLERHAAGQAPGRRSVLGECAVSVGGEWWLVCGHLCERSSELIFHDNRNRSGRIVAACRLTAFLIDDWDTIRRLHSCADLERFRRFARRHPYDRDVQRGLLIGLLLQLSCGDIRTARHANVRGRSLARRERQRMLDRLQSALRRLRQRIRAASATTGR